MSKYIENEIIHIDDQIEYMLLRAHNFMGGMSPSLHTTFILQDNKFIDKEVTYTPALVKSICEIIDNSIDEAIRCNFELGDKIQVDISSTSIKVSDNGRGIPTKNDNNGNPMFVTALTNVQAGSNFTDDENNNKKGTNGIGASGAFILSKSATCVVMTTDTYGILETNNNTRDIKFNIKKQKNKITGTEITIIPDLERFGVASITKDHLDVVYTYLVNQSVCYPKIKFYFNKKVIKASSFKEFIKFYSDDSVCVYNDDILDIAVYPSNEYKSTYFINGLNVYDGGDALDYIVNSINNGLKSFAPKKYNKLTSSNFKNRLGYIVIYKNRTDLAWSGQTKQKCNSTYTKLQSPKIDWLIVTKELYKNKEIINPVLELFKIQEEYEAKKALKELNKDKKEDEILYDSYYPATKEKKYLVISEGKSARASQQKALGNFEFGFYELTGVPANVLEMSAKDFKDNKRGMPELYEIINNENYDYVLLGSDADADGAHINGLLIGFIYTYMKDLLLSNKVGFLKMPLIVVRDKKGKLIETLYSISEYQLFLSKNKDTSKYVFDYKKGYGSLNGPKEMQEFLDKDGLKKVIDIIEWDESDEEIIETWLSSSADALLKRKEIISGNEFDINKVV